MGLLNVPMRDPAGKGRVARRRRPRPVGEDDMLVPWGGEGDIVYFLFPFWGLNGGRKRWSVREGWVVLDVVQHGPLKGGR